MKTKLLRKIRKQYSIVYFEKGSQVYGLGRYNVDLYHVTEFSGDIGEFFGSKNECIDWIIKQVKINYGNHKNNKGVKIWFNK